ncbi:unnamed protein product [Didymodactylos carnosus]|uniref:Uncharacterized protein n=1 Tax=Didymodactylos carnosus TaxID=1234261 RepID=A0A813S1N8_9BILA|nr:unnamed protein product [Didymodactylos carnosus]CAF0839216.1 unnamed protein product [Didymodactylos carnosus]CAF3577884.1 unnamed protein product [Didymodactylos carnosus]CAF3624105.1 unnamed protein product [Didymodactylos carnosus]
MTQKTSSHSQLQPSSTKNQQQQQQPPLQRSNNKNHLETIYEESGGSHSTDLNVSTNATTKRSSKEIMTSPQLSEITTSTTTDSSGLLSSRSISPIHLQLQKKRTYSLPHPEVFDEQKSVSSQLTSIIKTRKPRLPVEIRYRDGSKQYILPITNPTVQHYRQQLLKFNLPPKYHQPPQEQYQKHQKVYRRSRVESTIQKDPNQHYRKQFIIINADDIPSSVPLESSSPSSPENAPTVSTRAVEVIHQIPQQHFTQDTQNQSNSSHQQRSRTLFTGTYTVPHSQHPPQQKQHALEISTIRSRSLPPPPPRVLFKAPPIRYSSTDRLQQHQQQQQFLTRRTEIPPVKTKNTPSLQIKLTNENDIAVKKDDKTRKTTTFVGGVNSAFKPFSKRDNKHQKILLTQEKNTRSSQLPNPLIVNQRPARSNFSSMPNGLNSSQFTFHDGYQHQHQQYRSSIRPTSMHATSGINYVPFKSNKYRSFSSDTNRQLITNDVNQQHFSVDQRKQHPNNYHKVQAPRLQPSVANEVFSYNQPFVDNNKHSSSLHLKRNFLIPVNSTISSELIDDSKSRTRSCSNHNQQQSSIIDIDPSLQWYTFDSSVQDLASLSSKYSQNPIRITLRTHPKEKQSSLVSTHNVEIEQRLLQAGLSPETIALYERILEVADIKQLQSSVTTKYY